MLLLISTTSGNLWKELETRRSLRLANRNALTENDISRSEIRHQAVLQEHASSLFPAVAPAWFGPAMQQALGPITARLDNQRWHSKNRRALNAVVDNAPAGATPLFQVAKTIAGVGPGLPGLLPIAAPAAIPAVGAFPGPPFPMTVAALRGLTGPQLHQLAIFYNDSFGILVGDLLDVQVTKFLAYIIGE